MIGAENGVPIYVRQVADVKIGDAFRVAALVKGTEEAVGGVVVARYGVSTTDVIARVKEKIAALQAGLPPGVRIVPFYDRSALIQRAAATLKRALIEEAVVVTLVNILFLLHLRSILIVTIPIPLAVLTAFLFMRYLGITSNIMSLAGIAIAIGVLVDAAIVVTENAFRFIEKRGRRPAGPRGGGGDGARGDAPGRPADLLLDGDHHPGLHPGVRAHRPGGQAVPSARLHQDLRHGRRHAPLGDAGAGALHPADRRPRARRGGQSRHAPAHLALPAGAGLGAAAPPDHARGGRARAWRAPSPSSPASARSSCRR